MVHHKEVRMRRIQPVIALTFVLLLGQATVASATDEPVSPASAPPLPVCRYRDDATRYRSLDDWRITLLDTNLKVGRRYAPRDLVPVGRAGIRGTGVVRKIMIRDLSRLARAAQEAGAPIAVQSAYRSYATQEAVFASWVRQVGYERALQVSARPGHSEHQLGTALDLRSASSARAPWEYQDWGRTAAGRWMKRNAWRYGFILSYPAGRTAVSCYDYEPWHWRYVGPALAARIRESGDVPRRYLWENHETAPSG
jgi:zinc D-Ala-D-Ala carboxypeptidase